ncbi:MAG: hypothetical protein H0X02_07310 [Nitrosomonas sp.]|nr:hypothetical protein [Nitrosomonas sp.]
MTNNLASDEQAKSDGLDDWVRRIKSAVGYTGTSDHEDVRSILKEFRVSYSPTPPVGSEELRQKVRDIIDAVITENQSTGANFYDSDRMADEITALYQDQMPVSEVEQIIHLIGDGWLTEAFDLAKSDPKGKTLIDLIERCESDIRRELTALYQDMIREARLNEIDLMIATMVLPQNKHGYVADRIAELTSNGEQK